jgi:hypothetical protein
MTITNELKIFNSIYECQNFILFPLFALWVAGGFYFLFKLKKGGFFLAPNFSTFFSLHYKSHLFTALGTTEWNSNLDSIEKRKITYKF